VAITENAVMKATATLEFTGDEIGAMTSRRRAAFVNSLSGFKSANLVGSADEKGRTNLAIMSSAVHLGSAPPLLALIIRPGGEERHTLSNILATGCYSINHVSRDLVEAAHQTAARYDRSVSEFDATGLTPRRHPGFAAPFVAEAAISLGMELREHQASVRLSWPAFQATVCWRMARSIWRRRIRSLSAVSITITHR